jgi:predicted nucleotidyltransferase
MSHPEIIESCKKVIVDYLVDAIGQANIVSVVLYGSVARNEESYKYVKGKVYLESDIDVIVVVKNRVVALKWLLGIRRLSGNLSNELRKEWLLSYVNLSITTESRFLNARPNAFHLHLKLNGKAIYGKDLIASMPSYGYDQYSAVPLDTLTRMIFGHMIFVVRSVASSGIIEGNITIEGYNAILKSIRKLTLFLLRAVIIKNSIPVNPYDITDMTYRRNLYKAKNSICNDLLNSYEKIRFCDSKDDCSMDQLEKCLVTVISQFHSTIPILTGVNCSFPTLPKKIVFGHYPFIRRLEYSIYILLTNLDTRWTVGLFEFIIFIIRGPESIYLGYYYLFVSSLNLFESTDYLNADTFENRQSWLKRYHKSLKPWKYDRAE